MIGGFLAVTKSGIKSADDTSKGELPQRLRTSRREFIDKITETIKGGKLSQSDLAEAYCSRSNALSDLERFDEAQQDATEAARLSPNAPAIIGCKAYNYYSNGQFEKAVAEYSKAVSLGAGTGDLFRMRATAKVYLGRLEDAKSDLERASELADKESRTYFDLWLAAICGRLRIPFPEAIVKRAAAEANGEWPRPALAMMTGAISPEALLRTMDEKKGDDRQMAQTEGYFYLGQHYLTVGDKKTAATYFQKARNLDIFIYIEHSAAGFELQQLKNEAAAASAAPAAPAKATP